MYDLHCHLDGSMRMSTLTELLQEKNYEILNGFFNQKVINPKTKKMLSNGANSTIVMGM